MKSFKSKKAIIESSIVWGILITIAIMFLLPFIWMVFASFDKTALPGLKFPDFTLENYASAMSSRANQRSLINGIYLSGGSALLTTFIALLAAYPLSRFVLSYKYGILYSLLFLTGLPATAVIIPVYQIFSMWRLQNSLTVVMIYMAAGGIPYSVWLMKNFLDNVSIDLEEAAWVDGSTKMGSLFKIVFPLAFPGMAMVFIFNFSAAWGNFFVPYILLQSQDKFPAALQLYQFFGQYGEVQYGALAAFSMMYMAPSLILYIVSQRIMSQGFGMSGGSKE
ncbi:MAG: carbohydrate ABC transporter permease [Brevinema sp.]